MGHTQSSGIGGDLFGNGLLEMIMEPISLTPEKALAMVLVDRLFCKLVEASSSRKVNMYYWAAKGGMKMAADLKAMHKKKVDKKTVSTPVRDAEGVVIGHSVHTFVDTCEIPPRERHRMAMKRFGACSTGPIGGKGD